MNLDEIVKQKTMALRTKLSTVNPCQPRFVESDQYKFRDQLYKRLRIILRSNGCSIPTCTMCPFPNEAIDHNIMQVSAEQYIQQVRSILARYSSHEILSIYNDGNFFAEHELPQKARQEIYHIARENKCRYLMVESLPCFITQELLQEAKTILGKDVKLIVGIGLQSASDEIRQICIRAPITKDDFLQAHALLQQFEYATKCYIMVKPPFLLEEEAIKDAIESSIWLHNQKVKDITLCPTRIAKGTILQDLFDCHLYSMPKLTTFAECLHQLQQQNIRVRVSIFNIESSDFEALTPRGCDICENRILAGLASYNDLQEVDFKELRCELCSKQGEKDDPTIFKNKPYIDRVKLWLEVSDKSRI